MLLSDAYAVELCYGLALSLSLESLPLFRAHTHSLSCPSQRVGSVYTPSFTDQACGIHQETGLLISIRGYGRVPPIRTPTTHATSLSNKPSSTSQPSPSPTAAPTLGFWCFFLSILSANHGFAAAAEQITVRRRRRLSWLSDRPSGRVLHQRCVTDGPTALPPARRSPRCTSRQARQAMGGSQGPFGPQTLSLTSPRQSGVGQPAFPSFVVRSPLQHVDTKPPSPGEARFAFFTIPSLRLF